MFVRLGRKKVPVSRTERLVRRVYDCEPPQRGRFLPMRTRLSLASCLAGTLVLGAAASAQAAPAAWDVIVTVRKDPIGADHVTVGARAADYPPELLRAQMVELGRRLGSGARGVSVLREPIQPGNGSLTVLRGACAVDGLIDATTGALAVPPIAQAFAGAPAPHAVRRMLVSFDGQRPGPKTVAYHTAGPGSDLAFVGRTVGSSVEYDVELRSQDPSRLVVSRAAMPAASTKAARAKGADPATVALFAVAALAAGALVYCGLLLLGRRPSTKS